MSSFEKWAKDNDYTDEDDFRFSTLKKAYNAALKQSAAIAENMEGSWADVERNEVCQEIAAAIRKLEV